MTKRTNKTSPKCSVFYRGSPRTRFPPASVSPHGVLSEIPDLHSITTQHITLSLPIPPSINHQYATVQGRRVLSSTGRRYKTTVAQLLWAALMTVQSHQEILHTFQQHFLGLTIRQYAPSLLRQDIDSGLKITQDALCEALEVNDNRIVEIHLYKFLDHTHPRIECSLSLHSPLSPPSSKARLSSQNPLLAKGNGNRLKKKKP